MACAVALHVLDHSFVELLSVFCQCHVDEVDDDDAAHVSQPQLACQFVGGSEVDFQCVGFLPFAVLGAVSAVDVHDVQCFGMLDDEIGAVLVADGFSEGCLDLPCDVEVVENGQFAFVELYDVVHLGCDELDVVPNLVEDAWVVDVDVLVSGIEEVSQECHCAACLFVAECGQLLGLLHLLDGFFPSFQQQHQFLVKLLYSFAFGDGANDDAEVLGLDTLDDLLEACALGAGFDFGADVYFLREGDENEEASGKSNLASEAWSLGGDGFLDDLHKEFLSDLQGVLHASFLGQFGLNAGLVHG